MRISINQLFKAISFILLAIAAVVAGSPLINLSELQFPERLDSLNLSIAQREETLKLGGDSSKQQEPFYYNPAQLGLSYKKLSVKVDEQTILQCWLLYPKEQRGAQLVIILHDIGESKIGLLPTAKEFVDRGFSVCLADMRAHGESSGNSFTLGNLEKYDIAKLSDTLIKYTNNSRIALMGIGIGANIALQAAAINKNIKCLLLQSPTDSLSSYTKRYSVKKWGPLSNLFYPIMIRNLKKDVGLNIDTVTMTKIAAHTKISISIVAGVSDDIMPISESYKVFNSCPSLDKEYWPVREANHYNIAEKAGAEYYNHLAYFINCALPKPTAKKSRFKKLV